jgi:hypothetical protein
MPGSAGVRESPRPFGGAGGGASKRSPERSSDGFFSQAYFTRTDTFATENALRSG